MNNSFLEVAFVELVNLGYHLVDTLTSKAISVNFSFEAGLVPLQQPHQEEAKEHPDMRNYETLNHHVPEEYEDEYEEENKLKVAPNTHNPKRLGF